MQENKCKQVLKDYLHQIRHRTDAPRGFWDYTSLIGILAREEVASIESIIGKAYASGLLNSIGP